ncbi:hypothetical protein ATEIFO6365_0010020200 [Aspergillus terreus]|uniref:Uncharacterized protein n=1 Tax=Aspergillus terreus TaxID=33178 RepID=A0A5M3ZAC2_ASPTE|nr:hypothetical protein ATETN484_0012018100 [Aspergillus terreus]GFF19429.1 hypothetical protein ATEIFO6365_0010020200 [Aspergillus terreus]
MSCANPIYMRGPVREWIVREPEFREKLAREQRERDQAFREELRRQEARRQKAMRKEAQRQEAMREEAVREQIKRQIMEAMKHPVTRDRIVKRVRAYKEFQANLHVPVPLIQAAIRPIDHNNRPQMAPQLPKPLKLSREQHIRICGIFSYYDIELDGKVLWMRPVEFRTKSLPWGFATSVMQPVLLRAKRPVHKEIWRQVVIRAGRVIAKEAETNVQVKRVVVAGQDRASAAQKSWGDPDSWVTECVVYIGSSLD